MKHAVGGLLLALSAGCASVEPSAFGRVEAWDTQFTEPRSTEPEKKAADIRRKGSLTIEEAVRLADLSNPELAAARKNIDLATAALWQARLYPNPAFLFEFEEYSLSSGSAVGKTAAGVSIPLVVGNRIRAATRLAESEREAVAIEFLGRRRAILTSVKRRFLRVLAASGRVALAIETTDLARSLRDAAQQRFAADAVPEMEVLKASVSLARAEADLRSSQKELAIARQALLAALGTPDWDDVRLVGALREEFSAVDFARIREQAHDTHPTILASQKRREVADHGLVLEQAKRWRDWELEFKGGRGSEANAIIEGGIRIPLPLSDRNQAGIRRAEIRIVQAQLELEAAHTALTPRVSDAFHTFDAARDRVALFRSTILPQARKALEQTHEGYRAGKFEYLDLLDAQRTLAEARIGFAAAVAELNEAAAALEELSGTRLVPQPKGESK